MPRYPSIRPCSYLRMRRRTFRLTRNFRWRREAPTDKWTKKFKSNSYQILEKIRLFVYNVFCKIIFSRRFDMNGIKGYISIREAAYRWGVSERRVNQYCAEGRIPGASRFGRSWAIPKDAEKPADPRKKKISKTIRRNAP